MRPGFAVPALGFLGIAALGFWLAQRKARKVKYFQQEELEVGQVRAGEVCKVFKNFAGVVELNELGAAAWPKWPPWQRHGSPPAAPQTPAAPCRLLFMPRRSHRVHATCFEGSACGHDARPESPT